MLVEASVARTLPALSEDLVILMPAVFVKQLNQLNSWVYESFSCSSSPTFLIVLLQFHYLVCL